MRYMVRRERMDQENSNEEIALRVTRNSITVNILLAFYKLSAGIVSRSGAMISDAVHSASDIFSTVIVIIGIHLSEKSSDKEHPYGHERLECVAAIILAVVLAATGVIIGFSGLSAIVEGSYGKSGAPGRQALNAALISICVKECMYWYTRAAAKKIKSGALMADAWHHRSDALSSIGAFAGIFGARKYPVLEPAASILICLFILKAAYDVFKDAVEKMIDKACDDETEEQLRSLVSSQPGVIGIDSLQTRMFGSKIYVDVEIACDGLKTLNETHQTAQTVHDEIEKNFEEVKHIMVHVNPAEPGASAVQDTDTAGDDPETQEASAAKNSQAGSEKYEKN